MSRKRRVALSLVMGFALLLPITALAHGHTQAGDYELEIGFHNEPAYQGEPNGLDLFVTRMATNEPVSGLEDTLRVEVIYGASRKELALEPQFEQEGAYTAAVLPTETGDYTWHIWGDIEGTPVDVSMTSSPDTFGSVVPKSELAFPAPEPTLAELRSQARLALIVGVVGAALGGLGLLVGFLGLRARRN